MNYLKKFLAITLIFVMQFQSVHASVAIGGGWGLNLIRVENSTSIFTAFKDGFQSTVAISPSSTQVAKSLLRGGLVGLALSAVTQALLDGVDYVMDSAKQELRYYKTASGRFQRLGGLAVSCGYTTPINSVADARSDAERCFSERKNRYGNDLTFSPNYKHYDNDMYSFQILDKTGNASYSADYQPFGMIKISLNQVATKIIASAEQGNPEAKAYIASVVQDMLEHDEDYRKSLEAQLDAKLKEATQTKTPDNCPSGIRNKNGDCWICSRESHDSIRGRVLNAKVPVEGLAQCEKSMNSSQLLTRYKAYSEFADAREAENRCWLPPDEHHITEAKNARNVANKCNDYLGILGKIR